MNYVGLICEYNPFHTGHQYQLQEIKKQMPNHAIVCVMSGNFVQRAEPAIANKFLRTKMALSGGADIVVQIPTAYTVCGGEKFASSALAILSGIKNLEYLAFGCETTNFDALKKIAEFRAFESILFKEALLSYSKSGLSYPNALCEATLGACENYGLNKKECTEILNRPNNILAIEYLKIIYQNNYNIKPIFIHRIDNYNSVDLGGNFTSATAIRATLIDSFAKEKNICNNAHYSDILANVSTFLPYCPQILIDNIVDYKLFDQLLLFSLRKAGTKKIAQLADCNEGIENRLYQNVLMCTDMSKAFDKTKTKRYTYSRLKRIALQCLLDITKDIINQPPTPYGKLLGIRKELKSNLSDFTKHIIIKHSEIDGKLNSINPTNATATQSQSLQKTIGIDRLSDDVHSQLTKTAGGSFFGSKLIEM